MKTIFILLLFATAGSNCNAQSRGNSLLEEAKKAIAASNAIYSDLALKNDGSILSRYTDDACLFPPNSPPLCGKDQILSFFKNGPAVRSTLTIVNVYGDGKEFVTEETKYELFNLDGEKIDDGKIIVLWKKTKDGWKMYRDMFSSNRALK